MLGGQSLSMGIFDLAPLTAHSSLICDMATFKKKSFDPIPVADVACKDKICACMVLFAPKSIPFNLICIMTNFRNKCFDLLTLPQGPKVCVRTEYELAWFPSFHGFPLI